MAAEYTVKDIKERSRLAADGSIEKIYKVDLVSAGGIYFTVDLPEAQMEPKRAAEIFKSKAQQYDRVKAL